MELSCTFEKFVLFSCFVASEAGSNDPFTLSFAWNVRQVNYSFENKNTTQQEAIRDSLVNQQQWQMTRKKTQRKIRFISCLLSGYMSGKDERNSWNQFYCNNHAVKFIYKNVL